MSFIKKLPTSFVNVLCFGTFFTAVFFLSREGPHRGYDFMIDQSYAGTITKKDTNYYDRASIRYFLSNGSDYYFYNDIAYNLAAVGDSIIKKKGTLATILKKRDTEIVFYPMVRGVPVKD